MNIHDPLTQGSTVLVHTACSKSDRRHLRETKSGTKLMNKFNPTESRLWESLLFVFCVFFQYSVEYLRHHVAYRLAFSKGLIQHRGCHRFLLSLSYLLQFPLVALERLIAPSANTKRRPRWHQLGLFQHKASCLRAVDFAIAAFVGRIPSRLVKVRGTVPCRKYEKTHREPNTHSTLWRDLH